MNDDLLIIDRPIISTPEGVETRIIRAEDLEGMPSQSIDEICAKFRDQIHRIADTAPELPVLDPAGFLVMTQIVARLDRVIALLETRA